MHDLTVLAIMPDGDEPAVRRDLGALEALGVRVCLAAFHRGDGLSKRANIDLGALPMGLGMRRVLGLMRALPQLGLLRRAVQTADCVLARNLDMGLTALAAGAGGADGPPLVYQSLDIHDLLSRTGITGRLARACERALLARSDRLVVSSPRFVDAHFRRYGDVLPEIVLRENRVTKVSRRPVSEAHQADDPLRLGWVGTLRCPDSLEVLLGAADQMPDGLALRFHGLVHQHALPDFERRIARHANVAWMGPYDYPTDLAGVYGGLDLVWAQDLWQRGTNSDWLLPNRIYEAGYHGCPVIAVGGTETARWVARHGTGWVLDQPQKLSAFVSKLKREDIRARRRHILGLPDSLFAAPKEAARDLIINRNEKGMTDVATAAA